MWGALADITVEVHLAYLLFAAFGGLLALRRGWWAVPHLVTVGWGIFVVAMQWNCPVTRLEKWLIVQGGGTPYDGAFVDRYLFGVYLPEGSQPFAFTLQLLFFVTVYAVLVRRTLEAGRAGGSAPGAGSELAGDVRA